MAGRSNTVRSFWARNREKLIDAGAAFSLANLCFVNVVSCGKGRAKSPQCRTGGSLRVAMPPSL